MSAYIALIAFSRVVALR